VAFCYFSCRPVVETFFFPPPPRRAADTWKMSIFGPRLLVFPFPSLPSGHWRVSSELGKPLVVCNPFTTGRTLVFGIDFDTNWTLLTSPLEIARLSHDFNLPLSPAQKELYEVNVALPHATFG